jgi:hypothetical protein
MIINRPMTLGFIPWGEKKSDGSTARRGDNVLSRPTKAPQSSLVGTKGTPLRNI